MAATVKVSKDECFVCHAVERTMEVKIKTPLLHTVVCEKHLYDFLKREKIRPKTNNSAADAADKSTESVTASAADGRK